MYAIKGSFGQMDGARWNEKTLCPIFVSICYCDVVKPMGKDPTVGFYYPSNLQLAGAKRHTTGHAPRLSPFIINNHN
jgi:hypothetical protein